MKYTLKELRARYNCTQKDISDVLEVSTQTYNKWERNPQKMPIKKCAKLAEFYRVKLDDIFFVQDYLN